MHERNNEVLSLMFNNIYIYIVVNPKRYTGIDRYGNISFPSSNRNGLWYSIDHFDWTSL